MGAATSIRIDGNVLLCGQDAHAFNTTVRENLLLANRSASERDLLATLDVVCLAEWVGTLPDGLDTLVGEGPHDGASPRR